MTRVALVLGGGGVKGLAHVGVWRALREAGVEVSEILGTSIGALVGAAIAADQGPDLLTAQALAMEKPDIVALNRWALLLNGIRQPAVFVDEPLRRYIERVLPVERFADLRLPLSMNVVDLEKGETVWFGAAGRSDVALADAVYASCALPVFYPPAEIEGVLYVDGGVLETLAIRKAAERGADLIIAVDTGAGRVKDSKDTVSKGLVAVHHRVFEIMANARKEALLASWDGPPLIYIRPRLDGYSTFDFTQTSFFLEEGYRAARDALESRGYSFPSGAQESAQ